MKKILYFTIFAVLFSQQALAQDFSFDEFVGTWEGEYTRETFGGDQFPMTLMVQADGFYTDSSGYFMPPFYYPDTQSCEFDEATNRLHFRYLQSIYNGNYIYQHFYYEVVSYTGNTLELHYNYWDDPEPHPQAGTIILVRAGVSGVGDSSVPQVAQLGHNYPNPFNPSTNIEFSIPRDEFVTLRVFDARGRGVSTLVASHLEAGSHSFNWNASGAADGVYLYQLEAGGFSETRKMTLVK